MGFILGIGVGIILWTIFLISLGTSKPPKKHCSYHKWVMDDVSKDLRCSECDIEVQELKWSDKDL